MPRLFAALRIPESLSLQLSLLGGGLSRARWIDRENYHITLAFFGNINHHLANDLVLAFSNIDRPAMSLRIDRLDVFGNDKPRALYAHIEANTQLIELQGEIERIATRYGVPQDKRKFHPHITLARLKGTQPSQVANFIHLQGGFSSAYFDISSFDLLSSRSSLGGGPYVKEARFELIDYDDGSYEEENQFSWDKQAQNYTTI